MPLLPLQHISVPKSLLCIRADSLRIRCPSPFSHCNSTRECKPRIIALASMSNNHVMPSIDAQDSPHGAFYLTDGGLNANLGHDVIQVLPRPSHPPTRQDWEAYRAIFTQLYRTENRSLKEVMSVMAGQYGFKATPRMFKQRVMEWKLNKNYKHSERKAVARIVERYRDRGDPVPPILLRGQPVKMHRIQRHCKIGQSVSGPFGSAGSLDFSVLENHTGQIQPGGPTMAHNKETYLIGGMRVTADNLQKIAAQFAIPLRQLSSPHELKYAELIIFQMNIYYEWVAQSRDTLEMNGNTALKSQAKAQKEFVVKPSAFAFQIFTALSSLQSGQSRAGWRLLHKAMDMIRPMLASKNPYILRTLLLVAWDLEVFMPLDFYRVIWSQISEMAYIILGKNDPHSKIFLAITHVKSKGQVYQIATRLIWSIFERTFGPHDTETMRAKSDHVGSLLANGDFAGAECLQQMLISDSEKRGDKYGQKREFANGFFELGCIPKCKGGLTEAKKIFRDALRLGREFSGEGLPRGRYFLHRGAGLIYSKG